MAMLRFTSSGGGEGYFTLAFLLQVIIRTNDAPPLGRRDGTESKSFPHSQSCRVVDRYVRGRGL